jgi:predicted O-methyltransferase YrrM
LITNNERTRILEIGGGRSSRYFARRVSSLTTIEEDKHWATRIAEMVSDENCNFEIEVTSVESWLLTRNKTNMNFDLVLIDGSTDAVRKKAIERLPSLNPAAVYILDNSDREIFNNLDFVVKPTKVLRKHGLVRHPFQATETTFYWFL